MKKVLVFFSLLSLSISGIAGTKDSVRFQHLSLAYPAGYLWSSGCTFANPAMQYPWYEQQGIWWNSVQLPGRYAINVNLDSAQSALTSNGSLLKIAGCPYANPAVQYPWDANCNTQIANPEEYAEYVLTDTLVNAVKRIISGLKYVGNFSPVFNTHLSGDSLTFTCIQEGGGLFYAGPQNPATFACPTFRFIYGLDLVQKIVNIDTSSVNRPVGSFIVSTGANSSKGGAITQASYLTTSLSFHADTIVTPKHTTAYTPLYDGEKWRYIANGDTTECTAVKTATGFRIDSVTLNVAGIPWTPQFTGFSANPTQITATYKWQPGRVIMIHLIMTAGTSNSTAFTITAPFKSMYTETNAQDFTDATNNSVNGGFAVVSFTAGSSTLTLGLGATSLPWTNTGGKGVGGYISYFANP